MSLSARNWAWDQNCPSGIAKSVLVYLADRARGTSGECSPSLETICDAVEHSEGAVRKALRQLAERNFIQITLRFDTEGAQNSNLYRVAIPGAEAPEMQARGAIE